jgi:hypothetical protein
MDWNILLIALRNEGRRITQKLKRGQVATLNKVSLPFLFLRIKFYFLCRKKKKKKSQEV